VLLRRPRLRHMVVAGEATVMATNARHVPVTGEVWLNGQGRPMATLTFPDGSTAILAIPHRDQAGEAESSQAYRAAMAALAVGASAES
jgi:hypothetical protein